MLNSNCSTIDETVDWLYNNFKEMRCLHLLGTTEEKNKPEKVIERVFEETFMDRVVYTGIIDVESSHFYIGFRYPYADGYGSFLIFNYFNNSIDMLKINNGVFSKEEIITNITLNDELTSALIPLTSNVADIVGGYKIIGNVVYIDMRITPTNLDTEYKYKQVLSGLPIPVRLDFVSFICMSVSTGQSTVALLSSEGSLLIADANNNVEYYVNGCYIKI